MLEKKAVAEFGHQKLSNSREKKARLILTPASGVGQVAGKLLLDSNVILDKKYDEYK